MSTETLEEGCLYQLDQNGLLCVLMNRAMTRTLTIFESLDDFEVVTHGFLTPEKIKAPRILLFVENATQKHPYLVKELRKRLYDVYDEHMNVRPEAMFLEIWKVLCEEDSYWLCINGHEKKSLTALSKLGQ